MPNEHRPEAAVEPPRRRRRRTVDERLRQIKAQRDHRRRKVIVQTLEAMEAVERLAFVRYLYDRYWRG